MFSGYGTVTRDEATMAPIDVLNNHDKKVRRWLMKLTLQDLIKQSVKAAKHPKFGAYIKTMDSSNKWGEADENINDLCAFDVWLKKVCLSEKRYELRVAMGKGGPTTPPDRPGAVVPPAVSSTPAAASSTPATASHGAGDRPGAAEAVTPTPLSSTPATVPASESTALVLANPPAVSKGRASKGAGSKGAGSKAGSSGDESKEYEDLTPGEKEAYKGFWQQFKVPLTSPPTTPPPKGLPTPSPATPAAVSPVLHGPTGVTPTCKRSLDMSEVSEGLVLFCSGFTFPKLITALLNQFVICVSGSTTPASGSGNGKGGLIPQFVTSFKVLRKRNLRHLFRKSTSMMSDGTGEVHMEPLVEGQGRTKRVGGFAVFSCVVMFTV